MSRLVKVWQAKVWHGRGHREIRKESGEMVYKTRKRYRWNAYQYKVSAETAGSVMEQIERERGSVDKESFLEASRPEDSPTHDLFEWDDSIAAENYRLQQSGNFIRELHIDIEKIEDDSYKQVTLNLSEGKPKDQERPQTMRAFLSATAFGNGSRMFQKSEYVSSDKAINDKDIRNTVLENAKRELAIFRRKYNMLKELQSLFEEIDKVI